MDIHIHTKAIELANTKIAAFPSTYAAYTDPELYEMLVQECEAQIEISNLTIEINREYILTEEVPTWQRIDQCIEDFGRMMMY